MKVTAYELEIIQEAINVLDILEEQLEECVMKERTTLVASELYDLMLSAKPDTSIFV